MQKIYFFCREIGHFTQLVFDRSTKMGCAITKFKVKRKGKMWCTIYLVCNYSGGQYLQNAIYREGPPAGGCRTGPHPNYHNLCGDNEPIDLYPFHDDYPPLSTTSRPNAPFTGPTASSTSVPPLPARPQDMPTPPKKTKSRKSKSRKSKHKRSKNRSRPKKTSLWELFFRCLCGTTVRK